MNVAKVFNMAGEEIKKPKKQTYRAMYKYSKAINDSDATKMFRKLNNQANARLHGMKSADIKQKIVDDTEKFSMKDSSMKDKLGFVVQQAKNSFNYVKESVLSVYYGIKAKF